VLTPLERNRPPSGSTPEHAIALVDAKKAAGAEAIIGGSTPFGCLQAGTPAAE
jgi:hypothetical protein